MIGLFWRMSVLEKATDTEKQKHFSEGTSTNTNDEQKLNATVIYKLKLLIMFHTFVQCFVKPLS